MRPVLHGDVSNAARALLAVPEDRRAALCTRLLVETDQADRCVRRTGRIHPVLGNGSLMMTARRHALAVEPTFDDPDYIRCYEIVLRQLRRRLGWKTAG